ncbi:NAD-dependent succinate-semialdehyde dehydrogenase [Synechococcus sp. WH 8016]|uniref:NAD-dependent succinate-semialdehyde dehydrogenase n=1 Tax=Synechococcus sp. WH 8016 TaxID=166318 RepID=UPI00022D9E3E|nr:NAD-dependent succinate-semialdehyde dehydrogenase [Synechococcus sp. WH 8016]EHA64006.1 Succinate-semialdehyde dehydrogenase (NAD(P)(+)) [Synechococcus sp. WH 8016]
MSEAQGLESINPATGSKIATYPLMRQEEIIEAIEKADSGFQQWRNSEFSLRKKALNQVSQALEANKSALAKGITQEMGKPIQQSEAEVEKCAWVCNYFAENGEKLLENETIDLGEGNATVTAQPLGILFAVMPWNFPLWQAFRAIAPTLMAGNTLLLKGASNVPGCSSAIQNIFNSCDIPEGVFTNMPMRSADAKLVIAHPKVRAVTLTGSEEAGRAVASIAGANLKKCVLELGGQDPYLILHDADLDLAADRCAASRMLCTGQVCIAAKRLIVVNDIYDEFFKLLQKKLDSYVMGDPMNRAFNIGPLARLDLRQQVHLQVQKSVEQGATLRQGGMIPEQKGWWYPITILEDVKPGMSAFDDEIFGPVLSLVRAENDNHAVELASDTRFGLGAAIFSANTANAKRIAVKEIEAGCVAINDFVRSDPRVPFGGIKDSGYGRELGKLGIHEFINSKSIVGA